MLLGPLQTRAGRRLSTQAAKATASASRQTNALYDGNDGDGAVYNSDFPAGGAAAGGDAVYDKDFPAVTAGEGTQGQYDRDFPARNHAVQQIDYSWAWVTFLIP